MYDATLDFLKLSKEKSKIMKELNLKQEEFILATIHRAENTNDINKLKNIIEALNESGQQIILPLHPRTKKYMDDYNLSFNSNVKIIDPVGYLEMISLEMYCRKIITDSGGVQKEAFFMNKPCITIRDETEWIETVENGWNIVVGTDKAKILDGILNFVPNKARQNIFGDGHAAEKILKILNK